jgi:formylmethanofuran dehydrogenase subunit C
MTLTLTLREAPAAPVVADVLASDRIAGMSADEVGRLPLWHGNRRAAVRDLFAVEGGGADDVRIEGDLRRIAGIGTGMAGGRLTIAGDAGPHLGAGMRGGEIVVEGDADAYAGAGMRGGRLVVHGSAGSRLGGALAGERAGMRGGEIAGRTGAAAGLNALAGTVVAFGALGPHSGAGMRRASIVALAEVALLPTYVRACTYRPPFLRLCLRRLRELGLPVTDEQIEGRYTRWSGDALELNRGEILILEAAGA